MGKLGQLRWLDISHLRWGNPFFGGIALWHTSRSNSRVILSCKIIIWNLKNVFCTNLSCTYLRIFVKFWGCLKVVFSTVAPHCSAKANIPFALERHDANLFSDRSSAWRTRKNVLFPISGMQTSCWVRVNITRGYTSDPTTYSAYLHTLALFQHQPVTHFFQHWSSFSLSRLHPPCPMSHFASVSRTFLLPPHSFDLSPLLTPRLTLPHLDLWGNASPDKYVFPTHRVHSWAVVFCIFTSFYIVLIIVLFFWHESSHFMSLAAICPGLLQPTSSLFMKDDSCYGLRPSQNILPDMLQKIAEGRKRRDVVFSSINTGQDEQGT